MLGSILPAKSLSNDFLQECLKILSSLEDAAGKPLRELHGELGNGKKIVLEPRSNGKWNLHDLKPMFKKLSINFSRL